MKCGSNSAAVKQMTRSKFLLQYSKEKYCKLGINLFGLPDIFSPVMSLCKENIQEIIRGRTLT